VCLVATVQELPLALIDAARVHEEAKGSALIVLGDHALATSMARLLAEVADPMEHRVLAVHSRDLDAARDKMPHAGLVVLGGSAMLTKAARLDTSRKRTHVGIAAPQVDPGSQERWAQRLQSDRWIPRDLSRSRTLGHDRERLVLDHRHVGRDIGR